MEIISIITTFYNAEKFLEYALKSISNQIVNNDLEIEYILVNDCSTDLSLKIAENFKNNNQNNNLKIYIYTTEYNLGCGGARNYGIQQAHGNYFMFLDADDYYINSDFVQRAVLDIKKYQADIIEYGVIFNFENGNQHFLTVQEQQIIDDPEEAVFYMFKDNRIKFNVWSKIYTKKIIESYPYSTSREYEDIRTIPFWLKECKRIVIQPTTEINYRSSNNSIIRDNELNTRLGTIKAITEVAEVFKHNKSIIKALYNRALIDISSVMEHKTSLDDGFNEMSKYNTKLLSYIYPNTYKDITFNIPEKE